MSKIKKLSIQGVRSFGPYDPKRIVFYTPLTLILGQNGCGKTTIIESLKYITTGEVPPGCSKGSAFVHDPKIASASTIKGQIKLLFIDKTGLEIVSTRSLSVTQKAKKLECKTLDATLRYTGADGNNYDVSGKCIDFQNEMTSLLGVSKPILENVIFCHQDESNWPLDEGKKVKDKFDAIFNATKYIKCLDTIRKIRKAKTLRVNHMTETLDALKSSKEQAALLKKELKEVERDQETIKETQAKLLEEQAAVKKELREILETEGRISTLTVDLECKKNQLDSIKISQNDLKASQHEVFTCSDRELIQMIQDFELNTNQQIEEQKRLKISVKSLADDIEQKKLEESRALQLMGNYEADYKSHLANIKKRDIFLHELASKYQLCGFDGELEFSLEDATQLLLAAARLEEKEKLRLQTKKSEYESKENAIYEEIDKLKSNETKLKHDIHLSKKHLEQLTSDMQTSKWQLSKCEEDLSSTNIDELRESLHQISSKIDEEEKLMNTSTISEEIEAHRKESAAVESDLDEIRSKITKMNKQSDQRSQLDFFKKEKETLENKIQFLKRKNANEFNLLFKDPVGSNIRNKLEAKMANIRRQIAEGTDKMNKLKMKKTELEMKISSNKTLIATKEKDFISFEEKLQELCHGTDLEQALEKFKNQMVTLGKTKSDCESSLVMFKGFLNKLKAGEGCPLCHRDFDREYPVEMLIEEIEGKLNNLPQRLSQLSGDLKLQENMHETLLQMKPQKERADEAQKEVELLKKTNRDHFAELENVSTEIESYSACLDLLHMEEDNGIRIQPDVVNLDGYMKNINQLSEKISNIQVLLGTSDDSLSMEKLLQSQTSLDLKIKNLRKEIEAKQNKIMDHNMQLQRLRDRKIAISTQELELRNKQQEIEDLKKKIDRLQSEKLKTEDSLEESERLIAPLTYEITNESERKVKIVKEKESIIGNISKTINDIQNVVRSASDIHELVKRYITECCEEKLHESRRKVESLHDECKLIDGRKQELEDEINSIDKAIINQKERKRNMDDEKKIRDKEAEAKVLQHRISDLEETIRRYNYDKIYEDKQKLLRQENQILKDVANCEGRLEEIIKQKLNLEVNLRNEGIKNAEKNYREKLIEMKCIEMACDDLNKYYKALETSVMNFHTEKMTAINRIIKELWRTTYKGNDIDYIEIKTDENESQGADKRRTYNYRVVMYKNEIEMDMRGRCSAGQKVLASLLIRMALSETFSSDCGILALDEPTTNLDRENIESLASSLVSIVNKRARRKNFQLIVITHDNEFLQKLARADRTEHYFVVSRDEKGLSTISQETAIHL